MEQLGIQPVQLLMQAINFVILLMVMHRLLYKPMLEFIEKRQKKIEEGLRLQGQMNEEKGKLEELKEKKIDEGRVEAREIIKEARENASRQAEKIIEEARKSSREEKEKAIGELESYKQQLKSQLKREAVELATSMAEKVITDLLTDEEKQRALLKKRIKTLERLADRVK